MPTSLLSSTSLLTLGIAALWFLSACFLFWRYRQNSKAPLASCHTSTLLLATTCWMLTSMAASGQFSFGQAYEWLRQVLAPGWVFLFPGEYAQGERALKVIFLESTLAIIWICLLRFDRSITSKGLGIHSLAYLPVWFIFLSGFFFLADQSFLICFKRHLVSKPENFYHLPRLIEMLHLCLLAPFIEEVFFRGWLLGWLNQSLRPWIANLIVVVCFTLLHIPNAQAQSPGDMLMQCFEMKYLLLAFASAVFGACYLQNRSLALVIGLHACYNAFALWINYFLGDARV